MMDFVYPLGTGSLLQDAEIGYSMRSLKKFVSGIRNIIVIGCIPRTLTGVKFEFIPQDDLHAHKQANSKAKLITACKHSGISDDFVWMNDDFIFCKPTEATAIPIYKQGSLAAHISHRKDSPNQYYKSLVETERQLRERGLPTMDFEVHGPLPVNKEKLLDAVELFDWSGMTPQTRSCYCNTLGLDAPTIPDFKIDSPITEAEIERRIEGRSFFSLGDGGFCKPSELGKYLEKHYPL